MLTGLKWDFIAPGLVRMSDQDFLSSARHLPCCPLRGFGSQKSLSQKPRVRRWRCGGFHEISTCGYGFEAQGDEKHSIYPYPRIFIHGLIHDRISKLLHSKWRYFFGIFYFNDNQPGPLHPCEFSSTTAPLTIEPFSIRSLNERMLWLCAMLNRFSNKAWGSGVYIHVYSIETAGLERFIPWRGII